MRATKYHELSPHHPCYRLMDINYTRLYFPSDLIHSSHSRFPQAHKEGCRYLEQARSTRSTQMTTRPLWPFHPHSNQIAPYHKQSAGERLVSWPSAHRTNIYHICSRTHFLSSCSERKATSCRPQHVLDVQVHDSDSRSPCSQRAAGPKYRCSSSASHLHFFSLKRRAFVSCVVNILSYCGATRVGVH